MSDYLPNEVIIEILSRLPVKSLIRFRCVCKTWCSLIASPHFIATHLNRALSKSNAQHPPYLLFHYFDSDFQTQCFTLHYSDDPFPANHSDKHLAFYSSPGIRTRELSLDQEIEEIEEKRGYLNDFLHVVGSSNGVVCLADYVFRKNSGSLCVLWNPSIQKVILLPDPNIGANFGGFTSNGPVIRSLGFGYDPKTDDYKLVKAVYLEDPTHILHPLVEIYSLRMGAWRSVTTPPPPYVIELCYVSVFLNGAVHWRVHTPSGQGDFRNVIVSLDMEDEAFGELAMPKSLEGVKFLDVNLAVIDGLLALVPCNEWGIAVTEPHSVWVMKEYGVAESWTKVFDICIPGRLDRVIGFTKNGEVLVVDDMGKLFSYEPSSQQALDLNILGGLKDSFYLDTYVESLVLLNEESGTHL
ncbi:F-box/kelch-repeat protein At3g06240-like [Alnus glutinosa]|uniref:F-box/kelch-repeat protein At3g06240-like n=1 Tax=Alnus glutinosa TaxID=3517 RepID=UPI002D76888D|nr:F-box/kelch-repeat protein At3g06240-like [Alnus glutinosa]